MKIVIIGCGTMGKALAERLSEENEIFLYDRNQEKAQYLANLGFGFACSDMKELFQRSEMILLCIKPQNINEAAELIYDSLKENHIVVSLLAGTPMELLREKFCAGQIVRMMPNLAVKFGEGVVGLASDETLKEENKDLLLQIFSSLGKVLWIPEEKMDALTALTGSGPAFFYSMIAAMMEAGVVMGFSKSETEALVYQMLKGGLLLLEKSKEDLTVLNKKIASPGGTTQAGLKVLEDQNVKESIINTFLAALNRAKELSSLELKG